MKKKTKKKIKQAVVIVLLICRTRCCCFLIEGWWMWGGIKIPTGGFPEAQEQDRSKDKWGNPHKPFQRGIMWGLPSCIGTCWQHHGNQSNWLANASRCAQCRSCYVGYWFFTCCSGPFTVCISCGFSGTQPSCMLTFHLVLEVFEGREMERGRMTVTKCSRSLKWCWSSESLEVLNWRWDLTPIIKSSFIIKLFNNRLLICTYSRLHYFTPKLLTRCQWINLLLFVAFCQMAFITHLVINRRNTVNAFSVQLTHYYAPIWIKRIKSISCLHKPFQNQRCLTAQNKIFVFSWQIY